MPNWTNNRLCVMGAEEDIAKFLADGKKDKRGIYSMNSWVPMPQTYWDYDTTNHPFGKGLEVGKPISWHEGSPICTEETIEDFKKASQYQQDTYGVIGWYEWGLKYWGVKWDAEFIILNESETRIDFAFDTAWGAPTEFVLSIVKRYPNLTIRLYSSFEDGGDIAYEFEGDAEPVDNLLEFIDAIKEMKDEIIEGREEKDIAKAYDEWVNNELFNIAFLSEYLEDDGDGLYEVSAEFCNWYENCYSWR